MAKLRVFMVCLVILLSSGIYVTRNFMNMAIVSMAEFDNTTTLHSLMVFVSNDWNHFDHSLSHVSYVTDEAADGRTGNGTHHSLYASWLEYIHNLSATKFNWSTGTAARLQGAFFLGYIFFQIRAASLAEAYGGRLLMLLSVFLSSCVSLVGPFIAKYEWAFIFSRFVSGLAQSCFLPSAFVLTMLWLPRKERSAGLAAISASSSLGTIFIYFTSGFISTSLGWPYLFWIAGLYGFAAFAISYAFLYSKPQDHPHLSSEELSYITSDVGDRERLLSSSVESILTASIDINANDVQVDAKESRKSDKPHQPLSKKLPVPWRAILVNKSFLVVFLYKICRQFLYSYSSSFSAIFNKTILKLSPEMNGMVSASSSAIHLVFALPMAMVSEKLIESKVIGRTKMRRLCCLIDSWGIGICHALIPLAVYLGSIALALALTAVSSVFGAMGVVSEGPIAREMSSNFGPSIYALLNASAIAVSIFYPSAISLILDLSGNNVMGWYIIHWIVCGLLFVSSIPYAIWASSERQDFDHVTS